MCRCLCATIFLLVLPPLYADAAASSNSLTSKEAADGWLLLFDGETTFGWRADADVQVREGGLTLGGIKEVVAGPTSEFGDFEMKLEYRVSGPKPAKLFFRRGTGGWATDLLASAAVAGQPGWDQAEFRWEGNRVSRKVRPALGSQAPTEGTVSSTGPAAIMFSVPAGTTLSLRNVKLKPLRLQPIFNGRDLTGWKEFTGPKPKVNSKFSATPEGWINIRNGPGDLQTQGQWADFVLQLECISNGKHLNSGVFFRCRPNEYQQGYEAQVRNEFTEQPKQKYVLEEYDPKTNQLKEKHEVVLNAVDYGTGAIYRRQPARRQASRDGEWFTMTIVAHGRHITTWVNGIQVTDWTDNRPLADNARNGCRLEKGAISLQGHDPTTDLSFRNFRIAELK